MKSTLNDLDVSPERGLDRCQVREFGQCTWIGNHLNILVLGPTGSGKSFFASALGLSACKTDPTVRYIHSSRLLYQLAQSNHDGIARFAR